MELVKIYTDSDFSQASVPEGKILTFVARDESDKIVTRYKNSSGEFGTLSGGVSGGSSGTSVDVTLGEVNADGDFVPLKFVGTEAYTNGEPETVDSYYGWNGVLPSPNGGIKVYNIGDAVYYKCVSVDTAKRTWAGYKLILTDGVHSLEDKLTEGLAYLSVPPEVGGVYTETADLRIAEVMGYDSVYAIPTNFTSNNSIDGYVINQSSGGGSYPQAWCVFNQNYTTGDYAWWTGNVGVSPDNPGWFSVEVPEAFVPTRIFIMNEIVTPENFKDAAFQGSNNGTNWDDLLTITGSPNTTGLQQTFDIRTGNAYKFFRMCFTASHVSGVSVQAFQIFREGTTVTRVPTSRL